MKIKLVITSHDVNTLDDAITRVSKESSPDTIQVNPTLRDAETETHSRTLTWNKGFDEHTITKFNKLPTTHNVNYSIITE